MHRRRHGHRDGGGSVIEITRSALDEIVAHARESAPRECCGLLVGTDTRVELARRSRNLEARATRFLIDPRDHFAAIHAARQKGRRVVGVYHSHPAADPTPSATDLEEATYGEYVYVIVGLLTDPPQARLFRLEGGNFSEQPLVLVP